jgi:hypothetical protein
LRPSDKFLSSVNSTNITQICQMFRMPSDHLPKGIDYFGAAVRGYWITSRNICKRLVPRICIVHPFSITLKNLNCKIKLREAIDSFYKL